MVEIDLFDFMLSYGIVGVLFTYGFIFHILLRLLSPVSRNPYKPYLIFSIFLIIGISLTSGHILNSGVAGFIVAILFAMSRLQSIPLGVILRGLPREKNCCDESTKILG